MSSDYRVKQFEYPTVSAGVLDDRFAKDRQVWGIEEDPVRMTTPDQQNMREAQAKELGRLEGETRARVQFEESLHKERERISESLASFQHERSRYFEQVESEVVQLSLAIARRVLRREAQIDPDLLAGLVRYTLEKLRDGTKVKLRVQPSVVAQWRMQFEEHVEIVPDPMVEPGSCLIETEVGTTAMNVDAQLKEIEHGLMDLLAQRPATI